MNMQATAVTFQAANKAKIIKADYSAFITSSYNPHQSFNYKFKLYLKTFNL